MKFGFIGVGNMGNPMALNLIKGGHALRVHDIKREATKNLIEEGATWADSPQDAAEGAESPWPDNAPHPQGTTVSRFSGGDSPASYPYPISDGSGLHNWGSTFQTTWPTVAPSNTIQRGVYDEYQLGSLLYFTNQAIIPVYDAEGNVTDPSRFFYEGTGNSIHISDAGQIQAGLRYGAFDTTLVNEEETYQFTIYDVLNILSSYI